MKILKCFCCNANCNSTKPGGIVLFKSCRNYGPNAIWLGDSKILDLSVDHVELQILICNKCLANKNTEIFKNTV